MPVASRCAAIIPCLNEAATIGAITRGLRLRLPSVIVVDDGSGDATADEARQAGATVVRLDRTLGKGAALRAGIEVATSARFDWALLMDGDGQHSVEDVGVFVEAAELGGAEMVIGNRMHSAESIPWLRRQVNRWMSRDLSRCIGARVPDSQCGFRLVELSTWNRLQPAGEGFLIESAMIVAFAKAGCRILHVPIRVLPREQGRSRIRSIRDTIRWLRWRITAGKMPGTWSSTPGVGLR